jgi:hypothetical protein
MIAARRWCQFRSRKLITDKAETLPSKRLPSFPSPNDCVKSGDRPRFFWRICRLLSVFAKHTVINLIVT